MRFLKDMFVRDCVVSFSDKDGSGGGSGDFTYNGAKKYAKSLISQDASTVVKIHRSGTIEILSDGMLGGGGGK